MRWLHFILSHSIFIAFAAIALCFQTDILLHTGYDVKLYALVFFATLCGYNLYWLVTKFYFFNKGLSISFFKINISFVLIGCIGFLGSIWLLFTQIQILPYLLIGAAFTAVYSLPMWPFSFAKKLQHLGFFKTLLLAFTWAYVTTILPIVFHNNISTFTIVLLFVARFLFMLLLCIIFDNRDIAIDKLHGLHTLATDIKQTAINTLVSVVFVLYCVAGLLLRWYMLDNAQMVAFIITAAIVWWVYYLSKKPRGYVFYYLFVDGMMVFTALASYIALWFA